MSEKFLIRTVNGPAAGTRLAPPDWTWPLPDVLDTPQGKYVKISESQLPPMPEGSKVLRGAEYRWQDDA